MVAFTPAVQLERKREAVSAPELGQDVEIVVSEISALDLAKFRNFGLEAQAKQKSNGEFHEDLGVRGIAELLQYAIIDPETGKKVFTADQLCDCMTEDNFSAFNRAFRAALHLNGVAHVPDESAEGNSEGIPSVDLPTGSP